MDQAKLATMYPMMTVRNKTSHSQQVLYTGGESCQIQPNTQTRIASKGLIQIPDPSVIELISPTISDLVKAKIIATNTPVKAAAAPAKSA